MMVALRHFDLQLAYCAEFARLSTKNHPRVAVDGCKIAIDAWCDGDEVEADRNIKMTTRLRRLGDKISEK